MTFSPAELVLLIALVLTSACVVAMYRKLETLTASQVDYRHALADSARSLDAARDAVAALNRDGHNVVLSLSLKIDEAQALLREIERHPGTLHQIRPTSPARLEAGGSSTKL